MRAVVLVMALVLAAGFGACAQSTVPAPPAPTVPPLPKLEAPPLPPDAASPLPADRPISLDEAVALALRSHPQLAIVAGHVESAVGRVRATESARLPTASVGAQYSKSGPATRVSTPTGTLTSSTTSYSTSVSGRQLIYDFGRTPAQIRQAREQQTSAQLTLARTRQQVVTQVKRAYYTLLADQQLVDVQRRNVADQQAHLELAQARYAAGVAPRADVVRAKTSVAAAVYSFATAQNAAALARADLNQAIGVDSRFMTAVQETSEPPIAAPASELVAVALANRPDIKEAQAEVRSAKEGLRIAQTSSLPDVTAGAGYTTQGAEFPPDRWSWSYDLAVSWPLFDAGATAGAVQQARGSLAAAEASLRQAELNVTQEVTQAYLTMQTAEQKVASADAEVADAEESLRLAVGRYEAGVAAYIEVLDAETALVTARVNRVSARYAVSTARAALELALGSSLADSPITPPARGTTSAAAGTAQ